MATALRAPVVQRNGNKPTVLASCAGYLYPAFRIFPSACTRPIIPHGHALNTSARKDQEKQSG